VSGAIPPVPQYAFMAWCSFKKYRNIFTFTFKRGEAVEEWRRLHNEELHNLYASPYIIRLINIRRVRYAGHVACMEEMRNAYKILIWKPEGKRPCGRPRRRWEGNIISGYESVVGSCEHDNESSVSIKGW
jgi:hypothetical protein